MSYDDILDDLDKTDPTGTGSYLPAIHAKYFIMLRKVQLKTKRSTAFIIEFDLVGVKSSDSEAPVPGEKRSHVWRADGEKREIGLNTWMQFLCAFYGVHSPKDHDKYTWKQLAVAVLDHGGATGKCMVLETLPAQIQKGPNAGKYRCHHEYLRQATAEDYAEFGLQVPG